MTFRFYRPLIDFKFIQFPLLLLRQIIFPKAFLPFFSIKITFLRFFRGGKAGCRVGISMRLFINLLVNINFPRTFKPRKRFCFVFAHLRTQLPRRQIYTFQTRLTRRHDWSRRIKFMLRQEKVKKIFPIVTEKEIKDLLLLLLLMLIQLTPSDVAFKSVTSVLFFFSDKAAWHNRRRWMFANWIIRARRALHVCDALQLECLTILVFVKSDYL